MRKKGHFQSFTLNGIKWLQDPSKADRVITVHIGQPVAKLVIKKLIRGQAPSPDADRVAGFESQS
jgi:hypothetical protein